MENIPAEVLELMFLPIASLTDIQKCFNTSAKWRQVIARMFADKSKYLKIVFRKKLIFLELYVAFNQ